MYLRNIHKYQINIKSIKLLLLVNNFVVIIYHYFKFNRTSNQFQKNILQNNKYSKTISKFIHPNKIKKRGII